MARHDANMKLLNAAQIGAVEKVNELLLGGANANARHVLSRATPLQLAVVGGHLEVARLLVKHGADVNVRAGDVSQSPLETAMEAGHAEIVAWDNRTERELSYDADGNLLSSLMLSFDIDQVSMSETYYPNPQNGPAYTAFNAYDHL